MPQLLNTSALVNQLINLSTEENAQTFVFCIWQTRDKMLKFKCLRFNLMENIILNRVSIQISKNLEAGLANLRKYVKYWIFVEKYIGS